MTMRETERPVPAAGTPLPTSAVKVNTVLPPPRPRQLTIPPPGLDELEEGYAKRPEGSFAPETAIDEQVADLESWAIANLRKERRENQRFWMLRGLGFVAGVSAAAGGALQQPQVAVVGGGLAALAVAIDAAWPTTSDRHARRRAIHDLRELQHTLKLSGTRFASPIRIPTLRSGSRMLSPCSMPRRPSEKKSASTWATRRRVSPGS